jgi:large subunit ribosomal protein L24
MKIKKGDNVIVIAGKDRGATGKVIEAFPREESVMVEGVNIRKRHQRARREGQKGTIIDKTHPVHVSNVMLADPKTGARTRIGKREVGGKLVRFSKKSATSLS